MIGIVLVLALLFVAPLELFAQASGGSQNEVPVTAEGDAKQASATQNPPIPRSGADISAEELANQVNNPAAPLTLLQFRDVLLPSVPGTNGAVNAFQIQPVLPIGPFHSFPIVQLVKITIPFNALPLAAVPSTTGESGMGDFAVVDLFTFGAKWGKWGFGPSLVFPTASSTLLGQGKWQAGPTVALIYTAKKNLTVGLIAQNPISFAGDATRPDVNNLIITPTLTYTLKHGVFAGLSDFNWTFNWEDGGAPTIPIGFQIGKIVRLRKQPVSLSIEVGGVAARPSSTRNPGVIIGFEITPIFNYHIGPRQKIRLRGKQ